MGATGIQMRFLLLFNLQPGQVARTCLSALYLCLVITTYMIVKSSRKGLFLERFGSGAAQDHHPDVGIEQCPRRAGDRRVHLAVHRVATVGIVDDKSADRSVDFCSHSSHARSLPETDADPALRAPG